MKCLLVFATMLGLAAPTFANGGLFFNRAVSRNVSFNVQRNVVKQQVVEKVVQQKVVEKVNVAQIITPVQQVVQVRTFAAYPSFSYGCGAASYAATFAVPLVPAVPTYAYGPPPPSGLERAVRELAEQNRLLAERQDAILRQLAPPPK